ncbi:putative spermidine/putrescine transport system permease protein [Stella humosa]|uniref:Putative spermidine/putrescine transport system permease protein n=1 Tax=Stella humosa TaxID=94 RepID=A0A3N1L307_9PROT|nr:putative spermidine/putrescine transport system permease protein [Stella humosa]
MRLGRWAGLLLLPLLGVLALFLFGLVELVWSSFSGPNGPGLDLYRQFFARQDYIDVLFRTLWVAALTTVVSLFISYPVAYFIARYPGRKDWLLVLILLPWLVSVVVRTYGWIVILGNRGLLNGFLGWLGVIDTPLRLLFNTSGVVIGLVHVFCPFMILAILAVFLQLERALEEASMSLGAGPVETFWRVVLPLSLPGVISGVMLVYLMSTGAIITPLLLGGLRDRMLGTQIYQEMFQLFDFPKAATLAVILTVTAFLVVLPLQWLERRVSRNLKGAA